MMTLCRYLRNREREDYLSAGNHLMGDMVSIRLCLFDVTTYTGVLLRSMDTVLGGQLGLALWEPDRIFHEEEGMIVGFGESHFRWDDAVADESYRFPRTLAQRRRKEGEPPRNGERSTAG